MKKTLPSSTKVVVIGGGVAGCSVAYHLAKYGWKDTILLERDQLTSGTTWHAAGLLGQLGATATITKLRKYSLNLYKEFEISCGTVIEIISNIGNAEFMDSLGVNRRSCIGSAFVKVINFISTTLFLLLTAYLGLRYFKKIDTREDLSDLISILKRRNSK